MNDDSKVSRFPGARTDDAAGAAPLPAGKLEMIITYLEMAKPGALRPAPHRAEAIAIIRARRPTVSFYRYLYDTVGGPWMWFERRKTADRELARVIHDPLVEVYVMYLDGVPAGYAELDRRQPGEVELAYFGLMPEFIGRGLGRYLLEWAIARAFEDDAARFWVHTCNFDHPGALAVYQRGGFRAYRQERLVIDDPREAG